MKIPIPLYRLEAILRHYSTLAQACTTTRSTRVADALRLSRKELEWLRREIDKHKNQQDKCMNMNHSATARSVMADSAKEQMTVAVISATSPLKKSRQA